MLQKNRIDPINEEEQKHNVTGRQGRDKKKKNQVRKINGALDHMLIGNDGQMSLP